MLPSFGLAAKALRLLADLSISGRHVGRLTQTIGAELVARRDEQAEAHRTRQLQVRVPNAPSVVAVEIDGGRMKYPEYRKAGLPVTSSWVESLIKEINYRVKGTEKFWNEYGAESVLAVRAAALCDDERLAKHLAARPGSPFYRRTAA